MNRLKELRKEKGLTLDKIQSKTGINRGTYNNYENGKTEPNQKTWQALADFFDVSIPYLQGKILFVDLSENEQEIFTDVLDVLVSTPYNKAIHVLEALLNSFKGCYFEGILELHQKRNRKRNN